MSLPHRIHGRRAALLLGPVLLLAASACASNTSDNAGPSPGASSPAASRSPTPRRSTPAGTTSPKPGSTHVNATPGKTGKPSPRATSSGGATATLARTCARRGVDQQTITITTTPGGPASYQTFYSDGSYAADGHSHYSSGYGGGFDGDGFSDTQKDGRWQATWTVPANAPIGLATVQAITGQGNASVTFNIVAKDGRCG
jgi:hypothetical protein